MAISMVNKQVAGRKGEARNSAESVSTLGTLNSFDSAELQEIAHKIKQLPLLPQALMRILQLRPGDDHYFNELERLTMEDPTLAVRVLSLANSASSSPATPILSIKQAFTRIGITTAINLVTSLTLQRLFVPTSEYHLELWKHSIRVAVATEHVAQMASGLHVDRSQAYLTGLLHDIGLFLMLEHTEEDVVRADESHSESLETIFGSGLGVFKLTHSELGYLTCKHWELPDEIAIAVRRHHDPVEGTPRPGSIEAVTFCVEIADRLALLVLDTDDFQTWSAEERIQRVNDSCYWSADARAIIRADALASRLERVHTQSGELIAGLGLD